MLQRTITGAVMAVLLIPVAIFSDSLLLPVVMAVLAAVAMGEMLHCVGLMKNVPVFLSTVLAAGLLPVGAYYLKDDGGRFFFAAAALFTGVLFVLFTTAVFSGGAIAVSEMSTAFLGCVYISLSFSCVVLLRHFADGEGMFYLIFLGAWATDIFAYFAGVLFGKHKLIPDVSPKKTVEGAVGGTLMTILLFAVYAIVMRRLGVMDVNPIALAAIGLVVALVAQIGDLSMSFIKRFYGIKDYGKIFPGHGGVLDRFDSILATSAFLYLLVRVFHYFNLFV